MYQRKTNLTNTIRLIRASLNSDGKINVNISDSTISNVLKLATVREAGQKHCVDNVFNDAYEFQQDISDIIALLLAKSEKNHSVCFIF